MYKNKYPVILLHGFMGFGEQDGIDKFWSYWGFRPDIHLIQYLRSENYEVFAPSIGPVGSAWDRACDAYYRIIGGTVDYGKVHSEKYHHARFGRTYPGILPDWGQPGRHEKIDLVGHSFGGPTVRVLADLLADGSEEERAGTDPDDLSPLFAGGKAEYLHSITTLAGVNNGTSCASSLGKKGVRVINTLYLSVASVLGDTPIVDKLIDFHMDQWGIQQDPAKREKAELHLPKVREIHNFNQNARDSVGYEMQIEGMYVMNQELHAVPNVYYFAVPSCMSDEKGRMERKSSVIAKIGSILTQNKRGHDNSLRRFGFDPDTWWPEDGFVNTEGTKAPFTEPSADLPADVSTVKPGMWYNWPVQHLSHVSFMGADMKKKDYYAWFDVFMNFLNKIPD